MPLLVSPMLIIQKQELKFLHGELPPAAMENGIQILPLETFLYGLNRMDLLQQTSP